MSAREGEGYRHGLCNGIMLGGGYGGSRSAGRVRAGVRVWKLDRQYEWGYVVLLSTDGGVRCGDGGGCGVRDAA